MSREATLLHEQHALLLAVIRLTAQRDRVRRKALETTP